MKHLGVILLIDLTPNSHVELTLRKIKQAAARIKALGDIPKKCKLAACYSWPQAAVLFNGNSYLPLITSNQVQKLQVDLNQAIRVALSCPFMIRGSNGAVKLPSIAKLRRRWQIPSAEMLKNMALTKLCRKNRSKYRELEEKQVSTVGVTTRNISSLRIPLAGGLMPLSVGVPCRKSWNLLPARIKEENNKEKVFRLIKSWVAQRPGIK